MKDYEMIEAKRAVDKMVRVFNSCQTPEQIKVASRWADLLARQQDMTFGSKMRAIRILKECLINLCVCRATLADIKKAGIAK